MHLKYSENVIKMSSIYIYIYIYSQINKKKKYDNGNKPALQPQRRKRGYKAGL